MIETERESGGFTCRSLEICYRSWCLFVPMASWACLQKTHTNRHTQPYGNWSWSQTLWSLNEEEVLLLHHLVCYRLTPWGWCWSRPPPVGDKQTRVRASWTLTVRLFKLMNTWLQPRIMKFEESRRYRRRWWCREPSKKERRPPHTLLQM